MSAHSGIHESMPQPLPAQHPPLPLSGLSLYGTKIFSDLSVSRHDKNVHLAQDQ